MLGESRRQLAAVGETRGKLSALALEVPRRGPDRAGEEAGEAAPTLRTGVVVRLEALQVRKDLLDAHVGAADPFVTAETPAPWGAPAPGVVSRRSGEITEQSHQILQTCHQYTPVRMIIMPSAGAAAVPPKNARACANVGMLNVVLPSPTP